MLDGHAPARPAAGSAALRLDPRRLGSGRHRVQLLATDIDGQATLSAPLDAAGSTASPPSVKIVRARGGHGVTRARARPLLGGRRAGGQRSASATGAARRGTRAPRHRYAHAGIYQVVVHVRDRLGNAGVVARRVSVR